MPASLGYDVDPATGNVSGTDRPPPMSVANQGRHYYNETRERILDPRTAAAIKAAAVRAGGIATTNKASGYTTTLIRAGLSGETRKMRKLVDDTDAKYLAGELPSSALAEGASPATIEERAQAQVSRQANLKDAKRVAIEDYIRAHPNSQLAIEEAIKTQKVTNREEKQRILEAERTPGTPEFQAKVRQNLDRSTAREREQIAWARAPENRRTHLAKAVRKAYRSKSAAGRALNKSVSFARGAIVTGLLTAVAGAVSAAVKFLSALPGIASNVHKIAVKGAQYNIPDIMLADYRQLSNAVGLDETGETISTAQGTIHSRLASVMTGDLDSSVMKMAGVSAIGGGQAIRAMTDYFKGTVHNPDVVMRAVANDVMAASFAGNSVQKRGIGINAAFSRNVADAEADFGMGKQLSYLFEYWQKIENAEIKESIRKETLAGGGFYATDDRLCQVRWRGAEPLGDSYACPVRTGRRSRQVV
jgi:hypothetical protein